MYRLLYVSTKSPELTKLETDKIVKISEVNNGALEISGILMEFKQHFIQYIEGPSVNLYKLFKKIKEDTRHCDVSLIYYKPLEERLYSKWGMSFYTIDLLEKGQSLLDKLEDLIQLGSGNTEKEVADLLSNLDSQN